MGRATVSIRPLLLLSESKLTAWPSFWGVAERVRDSWLPRSLPSGSLMALSPRVWMCAADEGEL